MHCLPAAWSYADLAQESLQSVQSQCHMLLRKHAENKQATGEFASASRCGVAGPVKASPPALNLQQVGMSCGAPLDMQSP